VVNRRGSKVLRDRPPSVDPARRCIVSHPATNDHSCEHVGWG
jgi:hypothetical protein